MDLTAATYSGDLPQDVFPAGRSILIGSASQNYLAADDFNGLPRGGAVDIGAYRWEAGGNLGWTLSEGFKQKPMFFMDGFESGETSAWSSTNH